MPRILTALLVSCALGLTSIAGPASADDELDVSAYVIELVGPDRVEAGGEVHVSLTATGDDGSPLVGFRVRFVRTGPGAESAESCPVGQLATCAATGGAGVVWYGFGVGPLTGSIALRAEVYSPDGVLVGVAGPQGIEIMPVVVCRAARTSCPPLPALLKGRSKKPNRDVLTVNGPQVRSRDRVMLEVKVDSDWLQVGRVKTLNSAGDRAFSVLDRHRDAVTSYRAVLLPNGWSGGDITPVVRLR